MTHYYINSRTQPNGEHQIHGTGCSFMPDSETRTSLLAILIGGDAIRALVQDRGQAHGAT